MTFKQIGRVELVSNTEVVTDKFRKRDFVIATHAETDSYPNYVKFQLVQDRTDLVDNIRQGELVEVSFDLRGREHNGNYYTNIQAWRVEKLEQGANNQQPETQKRAQPQVDNSQNTRRSNEDLPF